MKGSVTQEDLNITDPRERRHLYGQEDHVRQYGSDFADRLRDAEFDVLVLMKQELLEWDMLERLSAACENEVILISKPL